MTSPWEKNIVKAFYDTINRCKENGLLTQHDRMYFVSYTVFKILNDAEITVNKKISKYRISADLYNTSIEIIGMDDIDDGQIMFEFSGTIYLLTDEEFNIKSIIE